MKTGWKWSFVAHLAVGAVIAAQLALVGLVVTYIIPIVEKTHETVGEPLREKLPDIVVTTMNLISFFYNSWWLWVGILTLLAWLSVATVRPSSRALPGKLLQIAEHVDLLVRGIRVGQQRALQGHHAVLAAVKAGDAPAARDAMLRHLAMAEEDLRDSRL